MPYADRTHPRIHLISRFVRGFIEKTGKPIVYEGERITAEQAAAADGGLPIILGHAMSLVERARAKASLSWFEGFHVEEVDPARALHVFDSDGHGAIRGLRLAYVGQDEEEGVGGEGGRKPPPICHLLCLVNESLHHAMTADLCDLSRIVLEDTGAAPAFNFEQHLEVLEDPDVPGPSPFGGDQA